MKPTRRKAEEAEREIDFKESAHSIVKRVPHLQGVSAGWIPGKS